MKNSTLFAATTLLLSLTSTAWAATATDVGNALMQARTHLVAMLDSSDAATQDDLHTKITAASVQVDEAVAAILADSTTAADTAAKLTEFGNLWQAFKNTRETEIIPAIRAGKIEDAKALAKGIQAERIGQMKGILTGLGWVEAAPAPATAQ